MKKALSFLLAALLLAGCAAQPAPESAASPPPDSVAVESPSRPLATPSGEGAAQASQVVETTLSSGVVVQAEVSYPPVDFSSLASYQASLHRFDPQQARQLLLGDAPLAQEEQQAVKGSAFQDAMWHMYVTEDGQNLVVIEENLYYFNNGWNQDTTQYFYPGPESLDYNGDAFQTGKELAFATAEECFAQAKETLSQLGIAVADSYDCFTLDSETLQAEAEKVRERLVQNGVGLWTDEAGEPLSREEILAQYPLPQYQASQDCYYFQLYARAGACPVTRQSTGVAASGGYTMGAVIDCAYSAEGLVMLSIYPAYDVGEIQGEAPCLDLEGALEALDSKYNSLLLESPCQVEQIAFEYVPLGTGDGIHVTLIPAWRFLVKQELTFPGKEDASETVTMEQASYVFFNAATGQEIVTDLGGHMRNFLHFTASSLRRTVLAPSFVGAAVGQCALSLLSVYEEITLVGADSTASYLYEMGIYANFWVLFLLFGAIPGATLFCADWENRYIRFSAARAGKAAYGAGTAAACYLSGTGAVFVGEWLFFGALCLRYPLLAPGSTVINSWMSTPFAPLLTPQRILLFYAARFLIKACCAGFFSVAALWVSTLLPNVFVALASPLLLNYLWENVAIFLKLPAPLLFASVAKGNIPIQDSLLWTALYPVALFTGLAAVFGALFTAGAKRRLEHG